MNFDKRSINYIAYFVMAVPAIIYFAMVYRHAINIPYQDDYDAILTFLCLFKNAPFGEKLVMLFSQHNEHRLLYSRLVILSHYWVYGHINFRHLILFNALQLTAIFFLCSYFLKKCLGNKWPIVGIILSLGLFDLNNYENAIFTLSGMFNFGIILLFLFNMFLYGRHKKYHTVLAALLQAVTVFSGGNGVIATFFVIVYLVLNREKQKTIISTIVFFITAPLYYYHFESSSVLYFSTDVSTVGRVFFNAIGSNFGLELGYLMGIVAVTVLLAIFPLNRKFDFKSNGTAPLIAICFYVGISMLVMAFFRAKLPLIAAYSSRYAIYTHILCAVICAFLFLKVDKVKTQMSIMAFFAFFYFLNYNAGDAGFDNILGSLRNTKYNYPSPENGKALSDEACRQGIYCIEQHRADSYRGR